MAVPSSQPSASPTGTPSATPSTTVNDPDSSDSLHVAVVLVGLILMFAVVLYAVWFYGKDNETAAVGILGVFLPAVTAVIGFVFGIKTGTSAGSKAGNKAASDAQSAATSAASEALNLLNTIEPALDNVLEGVPKANHPSSVRGLAVKAGVPSAPIDLTTMRTQYAETLGELRGRLKQLGKLR